MARRIHSEKTKNDYTSQETKLIITSNVSVAIQLPSSVNMSRKLRETTGYKQRREDFPRYQRTRLP